MARWGHKILQVKAARVSVGICVDCGNQPARIDRIRCFRCGERVNRLSKERHRRVHGFKPSTRLCGECRKPGHDRRRCRVIPDGSADR